ncbi:MAG TPA: MFS transporter [Solirubrobacteraceae bacterium]|jgi:MFS family permease|nr:MFS transporter [Solirubrobacteraceae bacterium]
MRTVLKLPAYRRLLAAYTLNELAFSVGSLALAVLVYHRTGSAIGAMGFFLCAQAAPALFAPALVARLDRGRLRVVLPALYATEAGLFGALAAIAHGSSVALILVLAFADGTIALVARAIARAASVIVLNPLGLLEEGNALMNALFSLCFMLGPALAGVIVAARGTVAALIVNAALFGVIAVTLATSSALPGAAAAMAGSDRGGVRAALRYVRARAAIRGLMGLQALGLVFFTIAVPVAVVLAEHTLHKGAGGYGAVLAGWGAGAVVGSAVYARWHAAPARVLVGIGAGALGVGFIVMAAAQSIAVAVVGAAIAGVGNGVEAVAVRTAIQQQVEPQWMALLMGFQESLMQAVPGVGILVGGLLAELAGARAAFAVAGVGALTITAAAWVILRPSVLAPPPGISTKPVP